MNKKVNKVIILDRDGVLNKDLEKGVKSLDELIIYEDHIKSLKKIYDSGVRFCIASNQSNVGRGIISMGQLDSINNQIKNIFHENKMSIDHFLCCTHSPDENCACRKPKPGLIEKIKSFYPNYDFIFLGDSITDYEASQRAKIEFALIGSGKGIKTQKSLQLKNYFKDLSTFSNYFFLKLNIDSYRNKLLKEIENNKEKNDQNIINMAIDIVNCSKKGGLIITAGNGGSSAHSEHLTAELQVRFEKERDSIAAISLTSNSSTLTAGANDYSFDDVFIKPFSSFLKLKVPIILILFSTSGQSKNILELADYASRNKIKTFFFIGSVNSKLQKYAGLSINNSSNRTCITQDIHQFYIHSLCISIDYFLDKL